MTTAQADTSTRLEDLINHIREGKIIEAMHEFYSDDTLMTEPAYGDTKGLAANVEREQKFLDSVKEWRGFEVLAQGASASHSFYECTMDWVDNDGNDVHVEQVCVQDWRDGKIVRERFYYDMGGN
jgi:hypothetical protein